MDVLCHMGVVTCGCVVRCGCMGVVTCGCVVTCECVCVVIAAGMQYL